MSAYHAGPSVLIATVTVNKANLVECVETVANTTIGLERRKISPELWQMIWRMIDHEGVSIKGASRVTGVTESYIRLRNKERLAQVEDLIDNPKLDDNKKKPDSSDG